ncbi:MAG: hypothetical protein M1826_001983 [Phylliscum demangeonii]|nr:MAG: hypothetical protein M1826_001983 [Phylliscum demangeonii]
MCYLVQAKYMCGHHDRVVVCPHAPQCSPASSSSSSSSSSSNNSSLPQMAIDAAGAQCRACMEARCGRWLAAQWAAAMSSIDGAWTALLQTPDSRPAADDWRRSCLYLGALRSKESGEWGAFRDAHDRELYQEVRYRAMKAKAKET